MTHTKCLGPDTQDMIKVPSNIFSRKKPFYFQLERMDCGPTCIKMICKYYGKDYSLHYLRKCCHVSKTGVTMAGLSHCAELLGFETMALQLPFTSAAEHCLQEIPLPAIAFWDKNHFVVIYAIGENTITIADPAQGIMKLSHDRFQNNWATGLQKNGIVLLLQPRQEFFQKKEEFPQQTNGMLGFIWNHLKRYHIFVFFLICSLILISSIQYIFPFLTKSIIDTGIAQKSINFIYLILIVQLFLYCCQTTLSFLQNWIVLQVSSRLNILLSSDFVLKLTRLPISYYDNQSFGEIVQRINDHRRIESFFSAGTVSVILSSFSLVVFGAILYRYNITIFGIYFLGSAFYIGWIFLFLRKRKMIDYELFNESAANNELLYEFVYGMQEIKLQNSENKRTMKWAATQQRLFKINLKSAKLIQYQDGGAFFINQFKDIIITIIASTLVIEGKLTLGMLLAIQMIVGALNSPVQQLVVFIRSFFDVKLCLDRIGEVHSKEEEKSEPVGSSEAKIAHTSIVIKNLSFRYNQLEQDVLKDISFSIPKGKITAIVGASGSGKTTLIKILLGFYRPQHGQLSLGSNNLNDISPTAWRRHCGAVLQDGYIFADTIANNIAESDLEVDQDKLQNALKVANIKEFVTTLALGSETLIGSKGNGLSQGQKQRLLIARAVYKNPNYLFFDEATNALDTRNERVIMENLSEFYRGKTVVVVAHRLSTVRNADQIIVLDNGQVAESGTHEELVSRNNIYLNLIKNQLELSAR